MPPRRFENHASEPEHRYRSSFGEEENKEEPKEKPLQQRPKSEEKKPEQGKKEAQKEEEKPKKKELSPEEKQERRSEAIERSHMLKKQFEENPIPNDPSTVARLIIAEHILSIDEKLQDSEAFEGAHAQEKLEATLDFMCDLAEKLEDPTIESPPHIQDAYETLLELTEEALEVADTPQEIVVEIAEVLDLNLNSDEIVALAPEFMPIADSTHPPEQQLTQTIPIAKVSPIARNLLTYLHLASLPSTTPQPSSIQPRPPYSNGGSAAKPASDVPGTEHKRPLFTTVEDGAQETIFIRPKVHDAHEYHLAMQPNIAKPLAAVALASIVASAIHRTPEISHRHETTAPIPTSNHDSIHHPHTLKSDRQATQAPTPEKHVQNHFTSETFASVHPRPATSEPLAHTQPNLESSSPSGKLEHLSLTSLLALAQDVHVGHGRYLKAEFEHGRIDKDGLIKVLKAKKKGLDFSQEFNHQAANFRERLASIEFITRPPKPSTPVDNPSEPITDQAHESPKHAAQKEVFTHPIFERYAHPEKSLFEPSLKNTIPVNFIVAIVAIIIFGTLIIFLLIPA